MIERRIHHVLMVMSFVHWSVQHDGPHGVGSDRVVDGIPVDPALDPRFDKASIAIAAVDPGFPVNQPIVDPGFGIDNGAMIDPGFSISGGPSPVGIVDLRVAAGTSKNRDVHGYDPYLEGNSGFVNRRDNRGFLSNAGGQNGFIDDGLGMRMTDPVGFPPGGGILMPGDGVLLPPLPPNLEGRRLSGSAGSTGFGMEPEFGRNFDDRMFGTVRGDLMNVNRRQTHGNTIDRNFLDFGDRRNFDNGRTFGNSFVGQGVAGGPVIAPDSVAGVNFIGRRTSNRLTAREIGDFAGRNRGLEGMHGFRRAPILPFPEHKPTFGVDRPYNGAKLRGFTNIIGGRYRKSRMHSNYSPVQQVGVGGVASRGRFVNRSPGPLPHPARPGLKPALPSRARKPNPIAHRTRRPYYQPYVHRATQPLFRQPTTPHNLRPPITSGQSIAGRTQQIQMGIAGDEGFYRRYPELGYGNKGNGRRHQYYRSSGKHAYYF